MVGRISGGNRPGQGTGGVRAGRWAIRAALACTVLAAALLPGGAAAQSPPVQIDCPDAPLYAAGGFSLVRDAEAQGLVLRARLQHNRTLAGYTVTCTTAEAGEGAGDRPGLAQYDFQCIAREAGRSGPGGQASMRGAVPVGHGLDYPETQAAVGAAVCPAARLALARLRAGAY